MNEYQTRMKGLSQRLKDTPSGTKKMQEVKPLEEPEAKEPERQLMCWIPQSLKRELKNYANNNDQSVTAVVILAIKNYLAIKEQ